MHKGKHHPKSKEENSNPNMLSRMRKIIRAWNQSSKKSVGNPTSCSSSKDSIFKGSEENYVRNGARVLEESISLFHGKTNSIRQFSVDELNNMNVKQQVYIEGDGSYNLYQGSWEERDVLLNQSCVPLLLEQSSNGVSETVCEIVVATKMATHNNVHKLLGCCLETNYPVLVYEWVEARNLEDCVIRKNDNQDDILLEWKDRLRIAWEISHVVAYLHTAFPRPIIHRDLKPRSVLLDENNSAKLRNFSLSISIPQGQEFVEDSPIGTYGYCDPTYICTAKVTESSDVYTFGVLLLMLLTGKRAVFDIEFQRHILVDWVQEVIKDNVVSEIVDPSITENGVRAVEELQLRAYIQLALFCIAYEPDTRPTMVEVATALKSMIASPESIPTITKFQLPRRYSYNNGQRNSEEKVNVEQDSGSPLEVLTKQDHSSINSANSILFEKQTIEQVQCKEKKVKRVNKSEMMDKRVQTKKLLCPSSEPLQYLVGTEVFKNLPNSCKELHNLMTCQPHEASIAVAFSAGFFQYHDTKEEFEACFTTHDVVQFLSMQCLNSSCLQLFMRFLDNKCKLLEDDLIAFMCPKRLAMVKKHLIYTSQYVQYVISESQSKSYVLAPYYEENHWTLIVVCPQKQVVLFFDPMGSNLDGLAIKRRINLALRSLQIEISQEDITWRLVQCPRQENEAESGYYVMRYMYEIVTLYHQSRVNLEECFESESYTQQQIDEVRDMWARYFIDECT